MKYIIAIILFCGGLGLGYLLPPRLRTNERGYTFNQLLMLNDQSNNLINIQLDNLLHLLPGVARIRVGLIYGPGIITLDNYSAFSFDVVNMKSAPGKEPGPILVGVPVKQWGNIITQFLANKCFYGLVDSKTTSPEAAARLIDMKGSSLAGCPIRNHRGDIVGGVFAIWDSQDLSVPTKTAELQLRIAAIKIYDALEIRIDPQDRK